MFYLKYRMLKVWHSVEESMRCVVAPRWHTSCLAAAPLAVACFRHRVEWYRIQTTKVCGHRWFLLIGIQPPHTHGEKPALSAAHFLKGATFSSFRLLAKHRSTTCQVSSYQLASIAASIQYSSQSLDKVFLRSDLTAYNQLTHLHQ